MELTIDQALRQGVVAHKEGKLQDAERLYRAILKSQPNHPDANHNLGVLAVAVGKPAEAVPLFKLALGANPKVEQFWFSYLDALIKLERFDEAKLVLVEGERAGVSSEKLQVLHQQIRISPSEDEKDTKKGERVSEKRKRLAEKKKGKKRKARGGSSAAAPSQDQINHFIEHYQAGRLEEAKAFAVSLTQQFPKHPFGWKVLGAVLKQKGRLVESQLPMRKAIELSPQDPEAHSNLGLTLQGLDRLDEAEASYRQAIALKPDFAEAHCYLGNTLKQRGILDEAETSYEQALALKPDFADAQNNLLHLLTSYTSQKKSSLPIVKVDQEIKEINLNGNTSGVISNDEIIYLLNESLNIIKKYSLDLATDLSQTYRRNSVDLNCKRHKKIFDTYSIIPEFCFGCYKVQVEPRTVLELIKLFVVFDQIKLTHNNGRKCMIEMRSDIAGFYKGLIYCSNLKDAYQVADYLKMVIKEKIGPGLPLAVKRGCSEYSIVFPEYKKINKSGSQPMNYDRDWKRIEDDFDSKNSIKPESNILPSLSCLSLSDVLIIRNWIDYAKGIGDSSAQLLEQNEVKAQRVYEIAKSRSKARVTKKPAT